MQSETNGEVMVSDDGYWQYINGNWVPTELQNQALNQGAIPHQDNLNPQVANTNLVVVPNQSSWEQQTINGGGRNCGWDRSSHCTICIVIRMGI